QEVGRRRAPGDPRRHATSREDGDSRPQAGGQDGLGGPQAGGEDSRPGAGGGREGGPDPQGGQEAEGREKGLGVQAGWCEEERPGQEGLPVHDREEAGRQEGALTSGGGRRRLDSELVRRDLAPSRNEARALVEAGSVLVSGAPADKPARLVAPGEPIVVLGPPSPYVSRGGLKLQAALARFDVSVDGCRALD